jgi:4-amino-4-deoxy-L-arabinose transferase-like glycosyltransferase
VSLVLILGFGLRLYHYTDAPQFHDNPDEVQFAWAGLSLLSNHVPQSWSFFPEYTTHTWLVTPNGVSYPLVKPWLDHPPVFAVVTGAAAWLGGEHQFTEVTAASVRLPPIWLSTTTVVLGYALALRLFGRGPAIVAGLLLATAPGAVLFGRSVEPEALLAPLLLGAVLAAHRLLVREGGRGSLGVLIACCALAPLVKVPGVAIGGAIGVALMVNNRWRLGVVTIVSSLAGILLFALYGALLDWHLFVAVFQEQAAHRTGVMGAFEFIVEPEGLNRRFRDPWWLLGWIGIGAILWQRRRTMTADLIAWPVVAYAAAMLVMADQRVAYFGWYRIAVYPLLYLAAGYLVWRVATAPNPWNVTFVLITGGAVASAAWLGGSTAVGLAVGTLAAGIMASVLIALVLAVRRPPVARAVTAFVLALVLLGNVVVSAQLDRLYLRL